jgi:hypothetical protein
MEGYMDSHADGRTPIKRIGSFRDYVKAPKGNFPQHWHQNLYASVQYHDGRKQAAYWQSDTLVSFLLQDGKNTGVLPFRTSQCGLQTKRNKMVQISLAGRL